MSNLAIPSWSEMPALDRDILSFRTPKTDALERELDLDDTFQKSVIQKYHNTSFFGGSENERLKPNEAEKVIAIAARKFGKEAGLWTLKHVEEAFRRPVTDELGTLRSFFPLSQLRVLKFLTDEFKSQDFSLKVLKTLRFYDVSDEKGDDTLRAVFSNEIYQLCEGDQALPRLPGYRIYSFLPFPVVLLGDRFGKEVAQDVANLSKSHFRIEPYLGAIQQIVSEQPHDRKSWKQSVQDVHICEEFRHPDQPYLTPQQAIEKIKEAAKYFGKEMAEWSLKHVRHAFNHVHTTTVRYIYPLHQLEVLTFFINEFKCPKTALRVLKDLHFYDLKEEDRPQIERGENGEELSPEALREALLQPISMIGEKFGKEAADEAISLSASHCLFKPYLETDQGREKIACYLATFGQKKDLPSSCIIA